MLDLTPHPGTVANDVFFGDSLATIVVLVVTVAGWGVDPKYMVISI